MDYHYLTTHTSLSPIQRGFARGFVNYKKGSTRLAAASDKAYQLLAHGQWFSLSTPASSTTKTGHDLQCSWNIAESGIKLNISINQFHIHVYILVVYRSSETSTNQSDVIIRSDDRFLNFVVDSDSSVQDILTLCFGCFFFYLVSILTKILQFYPSWVFLPSYWQTSGSFVQAYFWHPVNTHIWTSLLFIYFPE